MICFGRGGNLLILGLGGRAAEFSFVNVVRDDDFDDVVGVLCQSGGEGDGGHNRGVGLFSHMYAFIYKYITNIQ